MSTQARAARTGDDAPGGTAPRRAALPSRGVCAAGYLLITVQLLLRAYQLRHGYFRQDDFEYVARASEHAPGWGYLMRMQAGQLMPGGFGLVWLLTRFPAYDWALAGAVTLALQAGAGLALFRLLRALFGSRPAILGPLAVYLFTPMTLGVTVWWAAALNIFPLLIAIPMALDAHLRHVREGRFRHALLAAGWTVFGLAFFLKAAAIPLLLFAVTSAFLTDGPWPRATLAALRAHLRAWILYAGILVAYAGLYLAQMHTTAEHPRLAGADATGTFVSRLLGQTLPVTLIGGPRTWMPIGTKDYALVDPSTVLTAIAWIAVAALIAGGAWSLPRSWQAWVIALGYVLVADVVPVVLGRVNAPYAALLGLETRYIADAAPVFALCLGLAFLPLAGEPRAYRPSGPGTWPATPALLALCLGGFTVHALSSAQAYAQAVDSGRVRAYVGNARAALAHVPTGAQIYDRKVPEHVQSGVAGDYALTSRVLAPMAPPAVRKAMRDPRPAREPLIFDDQGRLRPMDVAGPLATPPGKCWTLTASSVAMTLARSVPPGEHVARFDYVAPSRFAATVRLGSGPPVALTLEQGLNPVVFRVRGGGDSMTIRVPMPGAQFCGTRLTVGTGVPRT